MTWNERTKRATWRGNKIRYTCLLIFHTFSIDGVLLELIFFHFFPFVCDYTTVTKQRVVYFLDLENLSWIALCIFNSCIAVEETSCVAPWKKNREKSSIDEKKLKIDCWLMKISKIWFVVKKPVHMCNKQSESRCENRENWKSNFLFWNYWSERRKKLDSIYKQRKKLKTTRKSISSVDNFKSVVVKSQKVFSFAKTITIDGGKKDTQFPSKNIIQVHEKVRRSACDSVWFPWSSSFMFGLLTFTKTQITVFLRW